MLDSLLHAHQAATVKKYEQAAREIFDALRALEQESRRRFGPMAGRSFMVLCGPSGCGKSISIGLAHKLLPEGLAECNGLILCNDGDEAIEFLRNDDSEYEGATHIVYTVLKKDIAMAISNSDICPVVFME